MRKRKLTSHLFMVWFFRAVFICAIALLAQNAYADGKYFPEKAYKIPPTIPTQRAILVYKDAIEKLTIESALNGEGEEFGWIIPLPAKPTQFEKASPGLIKTFSLTLQPQIIHDLNESLRPLFVITVIITFGCLMSITKTPKTRLNRLLVVLLLSIMCFCILIPHLGRVGGIAITKSDKIAGVQVHDIQEIGSYELAVLEADNAAALDEWLSHNGFASLIDKDKAIISNYISDGWYFVAAKLRRQGSGYSRPHPLTMSFESKVPIYPIRLTSTVGDNVYLELFVIADKQARCDKLTLEVSDKYNLEMSARKNLSGEGFLPGFIGNTYHQNIGHPKAKEQVWDGCVLSKLCGTLEPDDMAKDIILEFESAEPYQKYYFSQRGAKEAGLISSLISWCFLFAILTVIFGNKSRKENRNKQALVRIVITAVLRSTLVWGLTYVVLPKIEVQTISGPKWLRYHFLYKYWVRQQGQAIANEFGNFDRMKINEAIGSVDDYFISKGSKNIFTEEKIKHEDSPGNYAVFENDRGIILRIYSREGYPYDFVLTSKAKNDEE
ncbi:MAG: DUF2330 domain-containing protein [bacterium]